MTESVYQRTVVAMCGLVALAVLYVQRRYLFAPPEHKITRKMLEQSELDYLFGPDVYEADVDEDEEEV